MSFFTPVRLRLLRILFCFCAVISVIIFYDAGRELPELAFIAIFFGGYWFIPLGAICVGIWAFREFRLPSQHAKTERGNDEIDRERNRPDPDRPRSVEADRSTPSNEGQRQN